MEEVDDPEDYAHLTTLIITGALEEEYGNETAQEHYGPFFRIPTVRQFTKLVLVFNKSFDHASTVFLLNHLYLLENVTDLEIDVLCNLERRDALILYEAFTLTLSKTIQINIKAHQTDDFIPTVLEVSAPNLTTTEFILLHYNRSFERLQPYLTVLPMFPELRNVVLGQFRIQTQEQANAVMAALEPHQNRLEGLYLDNVFFDQPFTFNFVPFVKLALLWLKDSSFMLDGSTNFRFLPLIRASFQAPKIKYLRFNRRHDCTPLPWDMGEFQAIVALINNAVHLEELEFFQFYAFHPLTIALLRNSLTTHPRLRILHDVGDVATPELQQYNVDILDRNATSRVRITSLLFAVARRDNAAVLTRDHVHLLRDYLPVTDQEEAVEQEEEEDEEL